jgi:hypothetical protein
MKNGYIKNPTQEESILELLRERGEKGAYAWEFTMTKPMGGLGIMQYNARIFGLRKKGYEIDNVTPGFFILKKDIQFDEHGQGKIL